MSSSSSDMSVNLDKYKTDMVTAWREVMDEKNPINWAIFGYEGQTFDLKLISKGDGGLEEMNEDFSSGKIMYALCRVKLKDRNIEKIALINWQGEGAPLAKKGTCANHVSTVKNFFKGVHVTLNARTEEDVDPDLIDAQVSKATAADGVRVSTHEMDPVGPIGAAYKRVNIQEEINTKVKDDFWKKEEQEEEQRKRNEQTKQKRFSQNEVKLLRRESQEYFHEQAHADTISSPPPGSTPSPVFNSISPIPTPTKTSFPLSPIGKINGNGFSSLNSSSSTSPTPSFSNNFVQSEKDAVMKASAPRKNSNTGNLVRDRIKSFDGSSSPEVSGVSNGNGFRNGGESSSPDALSVLRRKQMFESGVSSAAQIVKRNPSEEIKLLQSQQKQTEFRSPSPPKMKSPSPQPAKIKTPSPQPPKATVSPTPQQPTSANNKPANFRIGGSVSVKLAEKVNQNSEMSLTNSSSSSFNTSSSYPESTDTVVENKSTTFNMKSEPVVISAPPQFQSDPDPIPYDTTVQSGETGVFSGTGASPIPLEITKTPEIKPDMGLCAKALYDYQASDDTEITFDPGDMITNIEMIDEGWWEGKGPHGVYGLFPANYVELLN